MDNVNKTLYIPLYGKAYVSKRNIILHDPMAEEIWNVEQFPLRGKAASKWLCLYMGMRAAVFDSWVKDHLEKMPDAVVLHLGCGMDGRVVRVGAAGHLWYDLDFPAVIEERKKYYQETENYKMLCEDVRTLNFLADLDCRRAIVVMEGISMYLKREELAGLFEKLNSRFDEVCLLMDCYTEFAAKASKYKNPINEVGVTEVYGLDDPKVLNTCGLTFLREMDMTPQNLIEQLQGFEKTVFRKLYAGYVARKMYRLYEYRK